MPAGLDMLALPRHLAIPLPATLSPIPTEPRPGTHPVHWRRTLALTALGPLGYGLLLLGQQFPDTVEHRYSRGLYVHIQHALATAAAWSPIQVGETFLLALILLAGWRLWRGFRQWRAGTARLGCLLAHALSQLLATAGVALFLFVTMWGLNHARLPVASQLGLAPRPADAAALARTAERLAARAAAARPADFDPLPLPADWRERVAAAYAVAGRACPDLAGPTPPLRGAWISRLMTLASTTGIYCPFTGEPNVNTEPPAVLVLPTACHEVAHLRGFAREDEANFLAWWVGSQAPDPALRYACELFAWRHTMAELAAHDAKAWNAVLSATSDAVRADDRAIRSFWVRQPKTATAVLTTITTTTNHSYLKAAGHNDGVRSYGRMVDLLIAALDRT